MFAQVIDDVDQVGLASPLRPNPRFASFLLMEAWQNTLFPLILSHCAKLLCANAVFVSHYVFHLKYAKEIKEVTYFFLKSLCLEAWPKQRKQLAFSHTVHPRLSELLLYEHPDYPNS